MIDVNRDLHAALRFSARVINIGSLAARQVFPNSGLPKPPLVRIAPNSATTSP